MKVYLLASAEGWVAEAAFRTAAAAKDAVAQENEDSADSDWRYVARFHRWDDEVSGCTILEVELQG